MVYGHLSQMLFTHNIPGLVILTCQNLCTYHSGRNFASRFLYDLSPDWCTCYALICTMWWCISWYKLNRQIIYDIVTSPLFKEKNIKFLTIGRHIVYVNLRTCDGSKFWLAIAKKKRRQTDTLQTSILRFTVHNANSTSRYCSHCWAGAEDIMYRTARRKRRN